RPLVGGGSPRPRASGESAGPVRGRPARRPGRRLAARRSMEPRRAPLLAAAAPALHRLRGEAGARPCPRVRRGAKMAAAMAAARRSVLREGGVAGLIGGGVVGVGVRVLVLRARE